MNPVTARQDLVERLLGGPRTLRRREVARAVGISLLSARKLWRALGFPGVDDEIVAFTEADREALARTVAMVRDGVIDEATAIAMARALGQTTDRLVSWQTEALMEHLARQSEADGGAPVHPVEVVDRLVDDFEKLLVYSWRRHMAAVISQLADGPESGAELTVGFADLVSYTRLSQRLAQRDLGVLVQRFEGLAADLVTTGGGRVVKTVGDEVLFVADDAADGAAIALALQERVQAEPALPALRIGLACGPVLVRYGDVYGEVVNIAARLTSHARPGSVLVDREMADTLADDPRFALRPLRTLAVRGYRHLHPWLLEAR